MITAARLRGDERGSTLPLILGYAVLALTVVLVITAATSLHLERKRLFSLADGAALVGAEAFTILSSADPASRPRLESSSVAAAVHDHLVQQPGSSEGVLLVGADTPDGLSARVTLATQWRPPLLSVFVPTGLRIEVTAHARTALR